MAGALEGQHALVTGGGSGIGLASAQALAADGAEITLVGRNAEKLKAAAASFADDAVVHVHPADVADEAAVADAVRAADGRRPLTIAVANAGTGDIAPLVMTDSDRWHQVLATNLDGCMYTFKHAARAIGRAGGGALCAISSIAGVRTHRFMHAYGVSKAGVVLFFLFCVNLLPPLVLYIASIAFSPSISVLVDTWSVDLRGW